MEKLLAPGHKDVGTVQPYLGGLRGRQEPGKSLSLSSTQPSIFLLWSLNKVGQRYLNYIKYWDRWILRLCNVDMFCQAVKNRIMPAVIEKGLYFFVNFNGRFLVRSVAENSKLRPCLQPDWPFLNFRASKSADLRTVCSSQTSMNELGSSKVVKMSVGMGLPDESFHNFRALKYVARRSSTA